jgi:signal transduction histidine kinase
VADGADVPLHEFMSANRSRLLAMAVDKLKERAPERSDAQLLDGTPGVFDEIVKALRRADGLPDLPPNAEKAGAELGGSKQRDQESIGMVAFGIGAISDVIGGLGASEGRRFDAREYQVFNQCIDVSTAAAIEEYEMLARTKQQYEHSKRVGFLAHEIRNALASAAMAYASLKKGVIGINSKTGDVLGRSLTGIQRLIEQTLAAVQLEAGAPIECRPVDVASFVRQLEAAAWPERGVTITRELEDGLLVKADERLLLSAAGNLLQNALKFTRDGGKVVIRARRTGERVRLEVEDECGGLPPGTEQSLLIPFTQQGDDRRGLGLGLPIAREAIEAQGGHLTITSLPGKGCVFRLELPVARPA